MPSRAFHAKSTHIQKMPKNAFKKKEKEIPVTSGSSCCVTALIVLMLKMTAELLNVSGQGSSSDWALIFSPSDESREE